MKTLMKILVSLAVLSFILSPAVSSAYLTAEKARHKAINACKDKKPGDRVQFINRHGKRVTGVCQEEKRPLIAVPLEEY